MMEYIVISLWIVYPASLRGRLNRGSVLCSAGFRNWLDEVWKDYIHKVPVILHGNLQRESHRLYDPPTLVT